MRPPRRRPTDGPPCPLWVKTYIHARPVDVRFTPESGHIAGEAPPQLLCLAERNIPH
jgi:hypothetical protein